MPTSILPPWASLTASDVERLTNTTRRSNRPVEPAVPIPVSDVTPTQLEPPRPKRRIKGIGVELEGGWDTPPPTQMHGDGSVRVSANHVGEVSSAPLTSIEDAEAWVRANYPHHVDSSCGLHVHLSVNELNYSRLMEPAFEQVFTAKMTEFTEAGLARRAPAFDRLRDRLEGRNVYCQKKFIPEQQIHRTERYGDVHSHPRYTQLNFCYTRHGTVECRLFPCFPDPNDGVAAVRLFYTTVYEYLGQFRTQREQPITASFNVPTPPLQ